MKYAYYLLFMCIITFSAHAQTQLEGSDFSEWHTETLPGFITLGSTTCNEMPGKDLNSVWDCGNPAFSTSGSKNWPTLHTVLPDGSIAARLVSRRVVGVLASGNLFTGRVVRNMNLSQLMGFTSKDGKDLIEWGVPYTDRPVGIRVKCSYDGKGDEGSISAVLENRSGEKRRFVAIASFIGKTEDSNKTSCPTKVSEPDENGLRTIEIGFIYGGLPINYTELQEGVELGSADEEITHANVVFASSAYGDRFKGKAGATMIVKDFEFIYE